jgi:hypothetical protein
MVGVFFMFFEGRGREKSVKKSSSSLSHTSRGRRRPTVLFKTAPFGFFLCEQCMKRRRFWIKRAVSLKRKRQQKRVRVHIGPQFVICSIKSYIAILI